VPALVLALAGCTPQAPPPVETADPLAGTVTVFAAASLTETFEEIADAFAEQHPSVEIVFSFGGSSTLAEQIVQGAPVDVFAAASPATMKTVTDAGLNRSDPQDFATNTLEIATPPDNPGAIDSLDDFANPDLDIAVCAVEVPCGAAAAKAFAAAEITPTVDTYEQDVKAVLTKVKLDEVDGGMVYHTDVLASGSDVLGVEFDEAASAVNVYPIATISDSDAAAAFLAFVLSMKGQSILGAAGFGAP
jgi:molybdate transport system substrate-binding protein